MMTWAIDNIQLKVERRGAHWNESHAVISWSSGVITWAIDTIQSWKWTWMSIDVQLLDKLPVCSAKSGENFTN